MQSHICILQTALALISHRNNYTTYVLADAVSSCNPAETTIALYEPSSCLCASPLIWPRRAQMRAAGVIVTTTESLAYQLVRDAGAPEFKAFSSAVREEKDATAKAVEALLGPQRSSL